MKQLKPTYSEHIKERVWDWSSFSFKTEIDKKQEYVVHIGRFHTGAINGTIYQQELTFPYKNQSDFNKKAAQLTEQNIKDQDQMLSVGDRVAAGLQNMAEEHRLGHVPFASRTPRTPRFTGNAKTYAYDKANSYFSDNSTRKSWPRTVTAIVDVNTGKVYYGVNGGLRGSSSINPNLQKMAPKSSSEQWSTLNCSECDAMNKALNAGVKPKNMEIHTVEINGSKKSVQDKSRCSNCLITTSKTQVTSDKQ